MQRFSDTWRATVGSTAISIIDSVFQNSDDDFSTDDERQAFAEGQLEHLYFLYGETESKVRMVCVFF
jgi:hypothetical protein